MRGLLFLLVLLLLPSPAAAQVGHGALRLCDPGCRPADLADADPRGRLIRLRQTIEVDRRPGAGDLPLMVRIVAMASSEVHWNGQLIGRNGVPAASSSGEVPGRFVATVLIPADRVRIGENRLDVTMSGHRLWLPVEEPVHIVQVSPYTPAQLESQSYYRVTFLLLGLLAAAFLYFLASAVGEPRRRLSWLTAALALSGLAQLGVEVARAFFDYPYPLHLARVSAIAMLAGVSAVVLALYAGTRFGRSGTRFATVTGMAAVLSILFIPAFDLKAAAALLAGLGALLVAAIIGRSPQPRTAAAAIMLALVGIAALIAEPSLFLDRNWYLLLALGLGLLVVEQLAIARRARRDRDQAQAQSASLARRLAEAERRGEAIVELKSGTGYRRVARDDIVAIRAADDYSEAVLVDGRPVLITQTLSRCLETLPAGFVRVHRSWIINRDHLLGVRVPPGGGRQLAMSDGSTIPVGRRFRLALD